MRGSSSAQSRRVSPFYSRLHVHNAAVVSVNCLAQKSEPSGAASKVRRWNGPLPLLVKVRAVSLLGRQAAHLIAVWGILKKGRRHASLISPVGGCGTVDKVKVAVQVRRTAGTGCSFGSWRQSATFLLYVEVWAHWVDLLLSCCSTFSRCEPFPLWHSCIPHWRKY